MKFMAGVTVLPWEGAFVQCRSQQQTGFHAEDVICSSAPEFISLPCEC